MTVIKSWPGKGLVRLLGASREAILKDTSVAGPPPEVLMFKKALVRVSWS